MGLSGKGGSEAKARSSQVCTPGHHPPARLGALGSNFLSRKLIFSSCEKQKEEKHVNAEKSRSGRGSSCPSRGKSLPLPQGGHRSPGWPQTQHRHNEGGQLSQPSINTLLHLPRANHAPATAPLMFFPPKCVGSTGLCISQGEHDPDRWCWSEHCFAQQRVALIALEVGPLDSSSPSKSSWAHESFLEPWMCWDAVQGHPSQRGFHQTTYVLAMRFSSFFTQGASGFTHTFPEVLNLILKCKESS